MLELVLLVILLTFTLAVFVIVGKTKPKKMSVQGSHVLVTGGSSGIGLATARLMIKHNAKHVAIVGRDGVKLQNAAAELRGVARTHASSTKQSNPTTITTLCHDVAAPSIIPLIQEHITQHGTIDILVTSAGVSKPSKIDDLTIKDFEGMMNINYLGTVYCSRAVLPSMKEQGKGRLIYISSMAGLTGVVGFSAYTPSKFAVRGLAESLAMETHPYGIGVTVVNPPDVDTPMLHEEEKVKPKECKEISQGSGLFTADRIAQDIVRGIDNWKFFVNTGFDGLMLGISTTGMSPAASSGQVFLELFTLPLLRLVSLGYTYSFYRICKRCKR